MLKPRLIAAALAALSPVAAKAFQVEPQPVLPVEGQYPAFSPDGESIAFESRRADGIDHIFAAGRDGSGLRQLTHAPEDDETPVWSPDGKTILFARRLGEGREAQLDIFAMDAGGGNLRNLSNHPDAQDDHHKFSADGKRIIFNSSRATPVSALSDDEFENYGWEYDIWVMDADGKNQRPLVELHGWDTYPSFSPDGETILWRRVLEDGVRNSEIFIAPADGLSPKNISTHPAFDGYPAWSPDGKWIVFASNRDSDGDTFRLYAMRPDGSDIRQLTDPAPGVEDVRPAWSAAGREIIFNRETRGDSRIMILKPTFDAR